MNNILKKREDRIKILIEKGCVGDIITGKVYSSKGYEITTKGKSGYKQMSCRIDGEFFTIKQHQFIYYLATGEVVKIIDHINGIKEDNRIDNLRSVSNNENGYNQKDIKGYSWNKRDKKWAARIKVDGVLLNLKQYNTEEDARQAYLNAKKIHHII